MSPTYLSQHVLDQLTAAQQVIDHHLITCGTCATDRSCYERIEAERVFLRYGHLPRRTPGLTGARPQRRPSFGWFHRP